MRFWLATSKDGCKALYDECPVRREKYWEYIHWLCDINGNDLGDDRLNNQTWDDEPIKIEIKWIDDLKCKIVEEQQI